MLIILLSLKIGFGGDVNMGRQLGQMMLEDTTLYPFYKIDSLLNSTDLNIVNLEGVISEQGGITQIGWERFVAPPVAINSLKKAKIKIVSVANNHAIDFGKDALINCFEILSSNNIHYIGGGIDRNSSYKILIIQMKGVSVGIVGITGVSNFGFKKEDSYMLARPDKKFLKDIIKIMDTCDYKIVFYHGDTEYNFEPEKSKVNFAKWCIDNGFDIFIGHHPHVIQPIEAYKDGIIFYSLGNFVFRQKFEGTDKGLFTIFEFSEDSLNIECFLIKADYFPEITEDVDEIVQKLKNYNGIMINENGNGRFTIKLKKILTN